MDKILDFLGQRRSWAIPYAIVMAAFIIAPLIIVAFYSFHDSSGFTLRYFEKFGEATDSVNTFVYSIGIAMITTIACILIGYPAAYFMAGRQFSAPRVMALLFILPMWINLLLRTLATVALFDFLHLSLGEGALVFGMTYNFLPFMIYPIYNTLQKMDPSLTEAARDLGAKPWQVFIKVVLPLSMPGVYSGILMVFMPTISTFAVSELLTLNNVKLFGTVIQDNMNSGLLNYGSALSLILLSIIGISSFFGGKNSK